MRESPGFQFSPAEWLYEYTSVEEGSTGLIVYDLDRDGDDDVLVMHGDWPFSVYLQAEGTLQPSRDYEMPFGAGSRENSVAVGDLSGDGCTDVAIADTNLGLLVLPGRNCAR